MDENRPLHYELYMSSEEMQKLFPQARTTYDPSRVTCNQCVIALRKYGVLNG